MQNQLQNLLSKKSSELADMAADHSISGRGSMTKTEKACALMAAEHGVQIPDEVIQLIDAKKSDLQDAYPADDYHSVSKATVQAAVAADRMNGSAETGSSSSSKSSSSKSSSGAEVYPDSEVDGRKRRPREELSSHFDSAEARHDAIREATQIACDRAFDRMESMVVLESLRPKDADSPLTVQAAYMSNHPDEVIVSQVSIPKTEHPVENADKNPIRL